MWINSVNGHAYRDDVDLETVSSGVSITNSIALKNVMLNTEADGVDLFRSPLTMMGDLDEQLIIFGLYDPGTSPVGSYKCIGIGRGACGSSTGNNNIGIGELTVRGCKRSVAVGPLALYGSNAPLTSVENVALGMESLRNLASGSNNTAVGYQSGKNYTTSESANIIIGSGVFGTIGESNTTRIGNSTQTSCYVGGIYGKTGGGTNQYVKIDSDGKLFSSASLSDTETNNDQILLRTEFEKLKVEVDKLKQLLNKLIN